jgi:hypothetical protein
MNRELSSAQRDEQQRNPLELLGAIAKRTPDATLLGLEIAGFIAAMSMIALSPGQITFALPFVAVSAFGLWGIAEHRRSSETARSIRSALSMFQFVVVAAGASAVLLVIFAIAGRAIGTIVS